MQPSWQSLSPILRDGPIDTTQVATWQVITNHDAFIAGAVRRVVGKARDVLARFDGRLHTAEEEALQWVLERLVRRVHNAPLGLPVSERRDGERGSAAKWFFTVIANLTRDWLKSERRRMRRETEIVEHRPPAVEPEPFWTSDALRKLERLLARPERAGVPDTHVLAYLCQYQPDAVDEAMVERAAAYRSAAGSRSGAKGLFRPVDDTWRLLQAWRARHGHEPLSTQARAELAWVLRSEDTGPAETWRDRDRKAAKTASVTVGKWAIRCADTLTLPRK